MRSLHTITLVMVVVTGCNAPAPTAEPPAASKTSEPGRLAVGTSMRLHDDKAPNVKVFTFRNQLIDVAVGTRVSVKEDSYTITKGADDRLIEIQVEEGPKLGTQGKVGFLELKPIQAH